MSYKDKVKQREYQRKWMADRRSSYVTAWGGRCVVCGSDNDNNLQFDHVDPTTKMFDPAALWSRNKKVIEHELAKCQLLCRSCHENKTGREQRTTKHGLTMYKNHNCRCTICKIAKATHDKQYRNYCACGVQLKSRQAARCSRC